MATKIITANVSGAPNHSNTWTFSSFTPSITANHSGNSTDVLVITYDDTLYFYSATPTNFFVDVTVVSADNELIACEASATMRVYFNEVQAPPACSIEVTLSIG